MSNIFLIQREYRQLADMLIESGGELTDEISAALAINKEELTSKAINYMLVIKDTKGDVGKVDDEIKRLQAMKKSMEGTVERLENTIVAAMETYGITEIKGDTVKITIKKSPAVEIFDESLIPDIYKEEVPASFKIPKKDISAALKLGHDVPGARIVNNKSLQIK